jgi:hypothetical protein
VFPNAEALPETEWFYFAVASERDLTLPVAAPLNASAPSPLQK